MFMMKKMSSIAAGIGTTISSTSSRMATGSAALRASGPRLRRDRAVTTASAPHAREHHIGEPRGLGRRPQQISVGELRLAVEAMARCAGPLPRTVVYNTIGSTSCRGGVWQIVKIAVEAEAIKK